MKKTMSLFGRHYQICYDRSNKVWSALDLETSEVIATEPTRDLAIFFLGMHVQAAQTR
jgi:hypothetical protein